MSPFFIKKTKIRELPLDNDNFTGISSDWAFEHTNSATAHAALASKAEMEAGTESAVRSVSPLRIAQAIAALDVDNYSKYLVALNFGAEL